MFDLAIAGAGPAGLALAIEAARAGFSPVVFDRRVGPLDKACGEGLMPAGVRALEELGVRLEPRESAPFVGIRYLQEGGTTAAARFRGGVGLGVRRLALHRALLDLAQSHGAEVRFGCAVEGFIGLASEVELQTSSGTERARFLVAADGLASPLRRLAGLEGPMPAARRFGIRRHFHARPWSDHVDVHWAEGAEAYVTPAGPELVGVAFLWDEAVLGPQRFESLLARFPALGERLAGLEPASATRGAGPLERRVLARTARRFALLGDAAGYVDALSGEGISLAFASARRLAALLPGLVAGEEMALRQYDASASRDFARYALATRSLLLLSRHPALRRQVIRTLAAKPRAFESLLRLFA